MHALLSAGVDSPGLFTGGIGSLVFLILFARYVLKLLQNAFASDDLTSPLACKVGASPGSKGSVINPDSSSDPNVCWAGEFGRFKHCGLRPEPLNASLGPPEYSLEPLDLPLPQLSSQEVAALEELKKRVDDLSKSHRTDSSTLVRYLRARKFNLASTEQYFRDAAKWRDQQGAMEALTSWNLKAYEECLAPWWLSGGFLGHGKDGEMVAYERVARCNWAGLVRRMPWDELVKLDVVHCMRSLAACEEDCMRRGVPMGHGILIEDCAGFGFDQASLYAARSLNRIIENRNLLMPECLTRILIVRAPAAWVYAWKMFSSLLDPGIRDKVQVAGTGEGESLALLRKYIDDDEIPAYLGGNKYIEGDPECRKVLAPGGNLPEEALQRFLRLRAQGSKVNGGPRVGCPDGGAGSEPAVGGWAACVQRDAPGEEKRGRACCG